MFRVLVLSPQTKDQPSRQRRAVVVEALGDSDVELLNPLPGRPPKEGTLFHPTLFPDVTFREDAGLLTKADLVVADLTGADFKTGFLISEALRSEVPVLGLFWGKIEKDKTASWQAHENFYLEGVEQQEVRSVLRRFLRFLRRQRKCWGRLVVIDGIDGSGKATQIKRLSRVLCQRGIKFKTVDFPRYDVSFYGELIGRFLRGEFGDWSQVSPYLASVVYAADRTLAREQLYDWLRAGNLVIANRYVSANAHQAARLPAEAQEDFWRWVLEMEYRVNRIPREDLTIFIHVPADLAIKLTAKKSARGYLKSETKDIPEKNTAHQKEAEKVFLQWAKEMPHWVKIEGVDKKNKLLSPVAVQRQILSLLEKRGIIAKKKGK